MGKLIDGKWVPSSVITSASDGSYDRVPRSFLDTISAQNKTFKPEKNRYHLYVSYACPWAHRTLIFRKLKNLEDIISCSVVSPEMLDDGWVFDSAYPGATKDHILGKNFLREVYQSVDPSISTTVTVPILFDKKLNRIVNNESSQIIRIFNNCFNDITGCKEDFYPKEHRVEIDKINTLVYENINNGVYKTGFSKNQNVYEDSCRKLFDALDRVDEILDGNDYLVGDVLTEADLRLIPTLIRFDPVYFIHFKCSIKRICDYKNLSKYLEKMLKIDAIQSTININHIKRHYYFSHRDLNPFGLVPL